MKLSEGENTNYPTEHQHIHPWLCSFTPDVSEKELSGVWKPDLSMISVRYSGSKSPLTTKSSIRPFQTERRQLFGESGAQSKLFPCAQTKSQRQREHLLYRWEGKVIRKARRVRTTQRVGGPAAQWCVRCTWYFYGFHHLNASNMLFLTQMEHPFIYYKCALAWEEIVLVVPSWM